MAVRMGAWQQPQPNAHFLWHPLLLPDKHAKRHPQQHPFGLSHLQRQSLRHAKPQPYPDSLSLSFLWDCQGPS